MSHYKYILTLLLYKHSKALINGKGQVANIMPKRVTVFISSIGFIVSIFSLLNLYLARKYLYAYQDMFFTEGMLVTVVSFLFFSDSILSTPRSKVNVKAPLISHVQSIIDERTHTLENKNNLSIGTLSLPLVIIISGIILIMIAVLIKI